MELLYAHRNSHFRPFPVEDGGYAQAGQRQGAQGLHPVVLNTEPQFSETRSGKDVRDFLRLDTPNA